MSASPRASLFRLGAGAVLALAGLLIGVLFLPDASQKQAETTKALKAASTAYDRQLRALADARAEAERIRADQKALAALLANLPQEPVGRLHWLLSQKLFELAKKDGIRLISVKYGAPSREGTKDSSLESVDVEFNATGIYANLKSFMLALEGSKLPFAVVGAKMEESPEGAHLTITLRAFKLFTGPQPEAGRGEGA